jgi:hypothetical protein
MNERPLPDWMYKYPDSRDARIRELEKALLEVNDVAAMYRDALVRACEELPFDADPDEFLR